MAKQVMIGVEEGVRWRANRWSQRCCHVQTVEEDQLTQTTAGDWRGLARLPVDKRDEMLPPGE
jgi:hypothetical protein